MVLCKGLSHQSKCCRGMIVNFLTFRRVVLGSRALTILSVGELARRKALGLGCLGVGLGGLASTVPLELL